MFNVTDKKQIFIKLLVITLKNLSFFNDRKNRSTYLEKHLAERNLSRRRLG